MLPKAGLSNALKLLKPIKEKYPEPSYAHLFQLIFAVAILVAGFQNTPVRISWYCHRCCIR